jgi:VWFA-related protein
MTRLGFLLPIPLILAAQERPRFSSEVQLVMVDTEVTEKGTGRPLELLGPDDFEIYDDGHPRPVREFHFETAPLDFVFLLYSFGFAPVVEVNDFRRGLNNLIAELQDHDRAAVLQSDSASKVDLALTGDKGAIREALLGIKRGMAPHVRPPIPTHLYDAVLAATAIFRSPKDPSRRRVIVALTGDLERDSKIGLDTLTTSLLEADTTLFGVLMPVAADNARSPMHVGLPIPTPTHPAVYSSIRPAIEATGGEAVPGDLYPERLPELIRRIRLRYLLGFYAEPSPVRKLHFLDVRLTPAALSRYPNALVRARQGFYAEPAAAGQ